MKYPASFILRLLLVLAVSSLVLNDVARLVFPQVQQVLLQNAEEQKQDGNNPVSSLFEEEVKHKSFQEQIEFSPLVNIVDLDISITHRITDENVRHLAYLAIFTPPPDRA